jgi:ABC-type anion transport system duplicated permease subunit
MLRNLLFSIYGKRPKSSSGTGRNNNASHHNQTSESSINELYDNSRGGLRGVLIFLIASAIAFYFKEQSLVGSLSTGIMEQLGSTPPVILINCIFGASTISSLIIIAGRIYNDREPGNTSTHLWFRVFFYPLYFTSAALGEYFNVVFISGLVVLGLQHYNVWNYYMRAIEINTDKCHGIKTYNN